MIKKKKKYFIQFQMWYILYSNVKFYIISIYEISLINENLFIFQKRIAFFFFF